MSNNQPMITCTKDKAVMNNGSATVSIEINSFKKAFVLVVKTKDNLMVSLSKSDQFNSSLIEWECKTDAEASQIVLAIRMKQQEVNERNVLPIKQKIQNIFYQFSITTVSFVAAYTLLVGFSTILTSSIEAPLQNQAVNNNQEAASLATVSDMNISGIDFTGEQLVLLKNTFGDEVINNAIESSIANTNSNAVVNESTSTSLNASVPVLDLTTYNCE